MSDFNSDRNLPGIKNNNVQRRILVQKTLFKASGFILTHLAVLLVLFVILVPYGWMISGSFKSTNEIQSSDSQVEGKEPSWLPHEPTLQNYTEINKTVPIWKYLTNSLIISLGTMMLSALISLFAAYGMSRIRFYWKKAYEVLLYATQMFPGVAFLIPYYILFTLVGRYTPLKLVNTYHGLIFTYTTFALPFAILLLTNYIGNIPVDIDEQAEIDGCNKLQILFLIIFPLALPGIVSIGIYSFIMAWNEMLFATVLTRTQTRTVALGLMDFISVTGANWGGMMAACIIVTIPVLIIFIGLQKQIISGLVEGSVKG